MWLLTLLELEGLVVTLSKSLIVVCVFSLAERIEDKLLLLLQLNFDLTSMASSLLNGAITFPKGLGSPGSNLHARSIPRPTLLSVTRTTTPRLSVATRCSSVSSSSRPSAQPRFIQHKKEAYWFYRFLSIVYDHIINPGHWTEDMRDDALEPADLSHPDMRVVDVGGGTGFTTLGIVKTVKAKNVTILDQSPHQLAKAKQKEPLKECKIVEGDAEDLPFPTDYADRYVSAGRYPFFFSYYNRVCVC